MLSNEQLVGELENGTLVVTANQRLSRTLAAEYAAIMRGRGLSAWPTPQILSWKAWLQSVWRQTQPGREVMLSEAMCVALWDEIVAPDTELDMSGRLGRSARDAWRVQIEWQIPTAAIARFASHEGGRYCDWVGRYERRLAEQNWLDPAQRVLRLDGTGAKPARVCLIGFQQVTPAQLGLIERFRSVGWQIVIESRAPVASHCIPFKAANPDQELLAAANWAKEKLADDPDKTVAVVVPDLRQRQDTAERLFARVLDPGAMLPGADDRHPAFHLSVGRPLAEQALIHDALLALRLTVHGLDSNSLSRFLRSPYFGFAADGADYARLDARLRAQWFDSASVSNLIWICSRNDDYGSLHEALESISERRPGQPQMAPGRWASVFHDWLSALGWPGPRTLNSAELQTVAHWTGLLSEIGRLELLGRPMSASQALHHVEGIAGASEFQAERPEAPVQVLGVLEAAGSKFDAIWISGLDDQSFPAPPRPVPFIPAPLQKEHDVANATAESALRFARDHLTALCGSAPDIVLSWPDSNDNEPRRPSPLMEEMLAETLASPVDETAIHEPAPAHPWALTMIGSVKEAWRDEMAPCIERANSVSGGTRLFQLQSQCPFKANAALRLHAQHIDEPQPGMSPRLRGNLAHQAMDVIWTRLRNRGALAALSDEQRAALIQVALDEAWAANRFETQFVPDGINELERRRLGESIGQILALDLERRNFTVARHERREEIKIGGVALQVQIDRVDRLDDSRELIIDYKTGAVNRNDALGARPENPQLAVYATATEAEVAGVLYGQMGAGGSKYDGFVAEDGLVGNLKAFNGSRSESEDSADWLSLLAAWQTRLAGLAGDFASGDAKVDPTRNACRYCRFFASCRIRALQSTERSQ